MTYDPNLNKERPDVYTTPRRPARAGAWAWAAIGAVVVLGVVVWSMMGGPATDPTTTSSTTPPAVTDTAPQPNTMTAPDASTDAPARNDATPVAPDQSAPKP
ncbi:hypothetical protein [Rhizobium halophytocola]|uniref:SPOR domain-containing protein n=1 Tax=Rhizobium halophytocola TaxID=735519 RepID=A0ABS4E1J7_9HYPH|nr:hypothetical protein [Rhizobium halophytocola]MBP1851779.1 hypothetical protein [Rhizobium halophytocola]